MPIIHQLPSHLANLIAAGEVVERPASVVKELVENAVDAGASRVTVELRDGGMTFLRVTDDGCGMAAEDTQTAFLRHATSKIRCKEDLEAIGTMGFRGEALAAIASVSRIDLLTRQKDALEGTSLHLEAGVPEEPREAGCPVGTTVIVRDLFFNTPARMKFMKQDSVEAGAITGTVQRQALAHPEVAFRLLRDGKQILNTPGDGKLLSAMAGIYGREAGDFIPVDSTWEKTRVYGYVTRPSGARASRTWQIFFVNGRPVKSRLLQAALEEAYRNQMMTGKFPACVLHLELPMHTVDVNVHPAKTEIKFLRERETFDCVHYGVLAALNRTPDRPEIRFRPEPQKQPLRQAPARQWTPSPGQPTGQAQPPQPVPPPYRPAQDSRTTGRQAPSGASRDGAKERNVSHLPRPEQTFRTMTAEEYRAFATALEQAPQPSPEQAQKTLDAMEDWGQLRLAQPVMMPGMGGPVALSSAPGAAPEAPVFRVTLPPEEEKPSLSREPAASLSEKMEKKEPEQRELPLPKGPTYEILGELFDTYIVVQQEGEAWFIDKHAAHERILFEKFRAQHREIPAQELLVSRACRFGPEAQAILLENQSLLDELGFGLEEFGQGTLLLRRIPMDLDPESGEAALEQLAQDLLEGRREDRDTLRDRLLHTMACKAAIKAGWHTDPREREALVKEVLSREELKHCPHGRPICVKLTRGQLERQFGRS